MFLVDTVLGSLLWYPPPCPVIMQSEGQSRVPHTDNILRGDLWSFPQGHESFLLCCWQNVDTGALDVSVLCGLCFCPKSRADTGFSDIPQTPRTHCKAFSHMMRLSGMNRAGSLIVQMWIPRDLERTLAQHCEWLGSGFIPTDWASSGLNLLLTSKGEMWAFYHVVWMRDRRERGSGNFYAFRSQTSGKEVIQSGCTATMAQGSMNSLVLLALHTCSADWPWGLSAAMQPNNRSQTYL